MQNQNSQERGRSFSSAVKFRVFCVCIGIARCDEIKSHHSHPHSQNLHCLVLWLDLHHVYDVICARLTLLWALFCFVGRQGADTCAIGGVLQESAMMWAARRGYMTVVVDLLRVSPPTTGREYSGITIPHPTATMVALWYYSSFVNLLCVCNFMPCWQQQQGTCVSVVWMFTANISYPQAAYL